MVSLITHLLIQVVALTTTKNFTKPLLIFSTVKFDNLEETLIEKGLEFSPNVGSKNNSIKDLDLISVETESILQTLELGLVYCLKVIFCGELSFRE